MEKENKGLGASSLREDRAASPSDLSPSGSSQSGIPSAGLDPNAGSIAAARFELTKLSASLYPEPFGASRVSICAADLYALVVAAERYAAAPDLLKALQEAREYVERKAEDTFNDREDRLLVVIDAAISKATGAA